MMMPRSQDIQDVEEEVEGEGKEETRGGKEREEKRDCQEWRTRAESI